MRGIRELPGALDLLVGEAGGSATGDDFVKWAVGALAAGFDSSALRKLGGLDLDQQATVFESAPIFRLAVEELGFEVPATKDATFRAFLAALADEILNGGREPLEALRIVHHQVLTPLGHPADLMAWCFLWEGLDPVTFESLDESAVAKATRELARTTIAGHRP